MDVEEAYGIWSDQYDKNENKTRDLEAIALKATLANLRLTAVLKLDAEQEKIPTGF